MSRGNEGSRGKSSGRQGGSKGAAGKGGNRRNAGSQDHKGSNSGRKAAPTKNTRGGKNQVIGTSRSGNPVTKKEYIDRKKKESKPSSKSDAKGIRLNKYIANSGICSRRDADIYIAAGSVTVNGKPVVEMGYKVQPSDEVKFDGRSIEPRKKEYLLLNKPKGFITPRSGEKASKTVHDLMANASESKLHYIGRLGRQSVGLMVFTSDINLSNKLNNPNQKLRKIYHVALDRSFKHEDLMKIRNGINIDGEVFKVEEISYVDGGKNNEIGLEVHSGKDNLVQRLFDAVGYEVKVLDRVVIGGLTKKDLPRGNYRYLTPQEIINLKMI
ncbi:pseudouridine synthase [Nonlabens ponticola]|uniref:rRNA pseudouridine synthase n=1 Tax=Nonlabens ponticola TaxID=2496866 RepID=A0A3S9MWM8_9FLAO|nr:pseudouridine synthase [Nonlabens ponticola]AZQ43590.1 rRNA pseudouridine synthase [Nonlabens ponticola]